MSTPSSSSWVLPFIAGVSASLTAVWIFHNWQGLLTPSSATSTATIRGSTVASEQNQLNGNDDPSTTELMDAPDLDHRLFRKAEAVIRWRTSRLILVVERCTNDHNYSAILRTAEALGIQTVYMIDPPEIVDGAEGDSESLTTITQQQGPNRTPQEIQQRRLHHLFAQNATDWLDVKDFATSEECVAEVRKSGYQLWVTDLSQEAEALDFPDVAARNTLSSTSSPLPPKIALVMGTEAVGASQYILSQADKRVYLPLRGFADSLNLSVATALVLHHLFCLDPSLVGAMSEEERTHLRRTWYTKLCQQRILTSSQKKTRTRLLGHIRKCQNIYERTLRDPNTPLYPSEQKKLNKWPEYQKELDDLEALLDATRVEAAVQEWVTNPPEPLSDLRRADTHRVCYVGKNTKLKHKDHWKDMVATSNVGSIHMATATTVRERLQNEVGTTNATTPEITSNQEKIEPKDVDVSTIREAQGASTATTDIPSSSSRTTRPSTRRPPATRAYFVE